MRARCSRGPPRSIASASSSSAFWCRGDLRAAHRALQPDRAVGITVHPAAARRAPARDRRGRLRHLQPVPLRPARRACSASLIVVTSGVVIGGLIGLVAGVAGGWLDTAADAHHRPLPGLAQPPAGHRHRRLARRQLLPRPARRGDRLVALLRQDHAGRGASPGRTPPPRGGDAGRRRPGAPRSAPSPPRSDAGHHRHGQPRRREPRRDPGRTCPFSVLARRRPRPSWEPWPPAGCSSSSRSGGSR